MHLYDVEVGSLGANAVVGEELPGIVGAALAFQMREKRVAVAFFGDGATNTGSFHEVDEPCAAMEGPDIFCLEGNGWAESTPASQQLPLPVDELGKRAAACRMKLIRRTGRTSRPCTSRRSQPVSTRCPAGPECCSLRTHLLTGHFVGDPQVYRDKDALKEARDQGSDPAPRG